MRGTAQLGHNAIAVWSPSFETHTVDLQAAFDRGCTARPRGMYQHDSRGGFFSWLNAPRDRCELCSGPCQLR